MTDSVETAPAGSVPLAVAGALAGALVGAAIWAIITATANFQIGYMSIGVGFLAAYGARLLGRGHGRIFSIIGGLCALFGCIVGNVLSVGIAAATQQHVPVLNALVVLKPAVAWNVLQHTTQAMDILFYAIASYFGYKYAQKPLQMAPSSTAA